jgi:hypothetical protein
MHYVYAHRAAMDKVNMSMGYAPSGTGRGMPARPYAMGPPGRGPPMPGHPGGYGAPRGPPMRPPAYGGAPMT